MRWLCGCLLLLAAGCYDGSFGESDETPMVPAVTATIASLHELLGEEPLPIRTNLVVAGRVTTSDRSGNFYRTLIVEEEGGAALELMAGLDALHNDYPTGARLVLSLEGLALGRRFGVLQVGCEAAAGSSYPTDYLGSKAMLDRHVVRTADPLVTPQPRLHTLQTLHAALCGTLIRIEGLRLAPEEVTENCWSGYRRFVDRQGDVLYTYVRTYADFAREELPVGECSLVGILQHDATGGGRWILKLRDATDCIQ